MADALLGPQVPERWARPAADALEYTMQLGYNFLV